MIRLISAFIPCITLLACAGIDHAPDAFRPRDPAEHGRPGVSRPDPLTQQGIRIERDGGTVSYRGSLTEEGLEALRTKGSDPGITTLLVESTGGEIVVGMDFGTWVVDRGLNVVVDRACLSSCANYIFPAARNKEILPGAVVAWHGSAKQPGLLEELDRAMQAQIDAEKLPPARRREALLNARRANLEYLTAAIRKQDEFFFRIGVDEYVTRIGNEKYGVRGFFYLSVADMAIFGIDNVIAPENYPDMEARALARRVGFPVTLVSLGQANVETTR